jgi:hypothetical protein
MIERGGFTFQRLLRDVENPWTLLDENLGPGVVPAFADANSAQWILKLGLGDELMLQDEAGEPLRLRLVGLIAKSIFQRELLISEQAFVHLFPSRAGYSYFLVGAPEDRAAQVGDTIETALARYGFDATSNCRAPGRLPGGGTDAVGLAASLAAVRSALRAPLIPALREE